MANKHKKKKDMQGVVMITILILVVGFGIFAIAQQFMTKKEDPKAAGDVFQELYASQPTIGNKDARVKIVEFADFKCPSCKLFTEGVFPQIKKDYIDTGKVSFTFANYPFLGPDSTTAAEASISIWKQNPAAFEKFVRLLYKNQGDEGKEWATPSFLVDLAKKNIPEIDAKKLEEDLKNRTYQKEVENSRSKGYALGVDGTPSLFINGKQVPWSDYNSVKAEIDKALKGN